MAYQRLGSLRVLGQPDTAAGYSFNPFLPGTGWDVLVSSGTARQSIGIGQWPSLTSFECYQINLDGPVGSFVQVMINRNQWNFVIQGWQNYDDMQQPMLLEDGDEVMFAWGGVPFAAGPYTPSGGANVQPVVTMWFRAEIPLLG